MHFRLSRPRRTRTLASVATLAIVATVAVVSMQPASAAVPTLNAPGRIYPAVGTEYAFAGTDDISGDNAALTVSGMVAQNCNVAAPAYAISGCPRIQMALNTTEAGLLRLTNTELKDGPDVDPNLDTLVHSSGAVITEHTDPNGGDSQLFNFNGTEAMINDVLGDISFVPAAGYEERDTDDGALPNITIQAIQGNNLAESTTRFVYVKVESENLGPTLDAPTAPVEAPANGSVDLHDDLDPLDRPSVIDPEMCSLNNCGAPFTNPGLVEGDDVMLVVIWLLEQNCGTFSAFGNFPTIGNNTTNTSVHNLLTATPGGLGLRADQATAVETGDVALTLGLDLSSQSQTPGNENTVFAGVGDIATVRQALDSLEYQAPADDAVCHLQYVVSDLGNNGFPKSYEGSSLDAGGDSPEPGYEVPDALADVQSITFNVVDGQPDVTVEQTIPSQAGDPAGPNKPANFTITFNEQIEDSSFTAADIDLSASDATGAGGILTTVTPGLVYSFTATATGDGKIVASIGADSVFAAGHDGEAAFGNEPSTSNDNEITWDQTATEVTIDKRVGQADPTGTSPIVFTVVFSDTVTDALVEFTSDDVDLTSSTAGGTLAAAVSQPDALDLKTYEVTVTGMTTAGNVLATVDAGAVVDQALNASEASTSTDNVVAWDPLLVDNTPPDVVVTKANGQADPTSTSPINFTATFTEPVTGFVNTDVSFTGSTTGGGNLAAVVTGGPTVYNIAVSGMTADGDVVVALPAGAAQDAANNVSTASTAGDNVVAWDAPVVDNTPPDVVVTKANGQSDPTSTSPIVFTATFTEPVTGFVNTDVSFAGSTAGGTLAAVVTGGPIVYDITVSGMTTSGNITVSLPAGVAIDGAANLSTASTAGDGTVAWVQVVDNTPPTVAIDKKGGQTDPTSTSPIVFTATFSEPVTGLTNAEVSFAGSTAGGTLAANVTGGPTVFDITVSGMTTSGNVTVSLGAGVAQDAASNGNTASTAVDGTVAWVQVVDVTPPGVVIDKKNGQADPTSTSPIVFTATFTEPVSGLTDGDVTFTGSTAGGNLAAAVTGGPTVYDITVSGMTTSGSVIPGLAAGVAQDAAGNLSTTNLAVDDSVAWVAPPADNTAPTVTVNQAVGQQDPTANSPILFTATFSEPVSGLVDGDVAFTGSTAGGTLVADVTGGPTVFQIAVSGMTTTGTVVASIPAGAAQDAAANQNTASTATDGSVAFQGPITIATPGGNVTVTTDDGVLTTFSTQAPQVPPPAGFTFPFGELTFGATTAPGGLVTFTLTLPDTTDAYFKLVAGAWESFTFDGETGAVINGTVVTVTVRDNGRGDSDPTLGSVTDPAAPAKAVIGVTTTTTANPGTTSTTAGNGGTTATTARVGGGSLVRTGSDVGPVTLLGMALIGVGIVILSRRRYVGD